MTALDMKTKEQLLIEKIRLLENLVYNLTYRGERKERLNLRKQLTSLTDQINEVKKKKQQPMDYLNECIEKATPNLSKIIDVDKELAEIRGEQPITVTNKMIKAKAFELCPVLYIPRITGNKKDDINKDARKTIIDAIQWALSLKVQKAENNVFLIIKEENATRLYKNGKKVSPEKFTQWYGCEMTDEQKKLLEIAKTQYLEGLEAQKPSDEDIEQLAQHWLEVCLDEKKYCDRDVFIFCAAAKAMRDNKIPVSGKENDKQ